MDKQTKALVLSIVKWISIFLGTEVDNGADNCPLCQTYKYNCSMVVASSIVVCPVKKATGSVNCKLSPYIEWASYMRKHKREEWRVFDEASKDLALKKLLFLISTVEGD